MSLGQELCSALADYYFQVYQYSQLTDGGYRLETNHGPKRVSFWKNLIILEWAFQWREILANQGYRQVDRFIRTKTGAMYTESPAGYIVVQDIFLGDSLKLNESEQVKQLGHFVGEWFKACEQAQRIINKKKSLAKWPTNLTGNIQLSDYNELIKTLSDSMFTYSVKQYWPSIKKRLRQALFLEQASQASQREWFFPHSFSLGQWLYLEQGYVGFYCTTQEVSCDLRSMAQFMQYLFVERQLSLVEIEVFYKAFAKTYQADVNSHYNILAHLIYPRHLVDIINKYTSHIHTAEKSSQLWFEACQQQDKLDGLHLWLANYLDQGKLEKGLG